NGISDGAATPAPAETAAAPKRRKETTAAPKRRDEAPAEAAQPVPEQEAAPEQPGADEQPAAESAKATATTRPRGRIERGERVGLHDEISAVIAERGPMTAAEIAEAIAARGRYVAPRSTKPLDA